jgi:hypothetical protein
MATATAHKIAMTKRTCVSSPGMTPPALAATAMEGTAVTRMPIATPVSSVRRLSDCADGTGCSRGAGPRRASTRAVISRSTRSRKDSITASP